ncbi:MAG: hypothetical protein OJF49_001250 [Ktedonobacterales bacterium]|nr:MAG: hypothetical protein OJF49_001250 [Ktedonobacterales bacterium]
MSTRSTASRRQRAAENRKARSAKTSQPPATNQRNEQSRADARYGLRDATATTPGSQQTNGHSTSPRMPRASVPPATANRVSATSHAPPPPAPSRKPMLDLERLGAFTRMFVSAPPDTDDSTDSVPAVPARRSRASERRESGFSWRERDWGRAEWSRRLRVLATLGAALLILLVAVLVGVNIASRAAGSVRTRLPAIPTSTAGGHQVVLQPGISDNSPTPEATQYSIGVWVSNLSPPSSGTIKVFVRITNNLTPMPNVPVTISANGRGFSAIKTDRYGLATFSFSYSLGVGQAMVIYANATAAGQALSAQTAFIAGVGDAAPSGTPNPGGAPSATPRPKPPKH